MATHRISILGPNTLPDTSGSVYFEPAAINAQANDRYKFGVFVFTDSGTKISVGGRVNVPANYVGTASILLVWFTTATSGDVIWDVDYTSIADGDSADPSADQEAVTATVTAPGTARLYKYTSINLTSANLVANDDLQFNVSRDGATAGDTLAASAYLVDALLVYADA